MTRSRTATKATLVALALMFTLSACGSSGGEVIKDEGTKVVEKKTVPVETVETVTDETTGEVFNENDGPLDPKTLKLEQADPLYVLDGCKNEAVPTIVGRMPWDFDADGATDVVVMTKCPDSEGRNLVLMRATTRGWWPKRIVGPEIEPTLLTGECKIDESLQQLRCAARSFNPVTKAPRESVMVVQKLQGEWVAELEQ